jgi:hypothetical protein
MDATSTKAMMVCSTEEMGGAQDKTRIAVLRGHKGLIDGGIRKENRSDGRARAHLTGGETQASGVRRLRKKFLLFFYFERGDEGRERILEPTVGT